MEKQVGDAIRRVRERLKRWEAKRRIRSFQRPYRLHLGCGRVHFDGWVNIDANRSLEGVDYAWDLSKGIPVEESSCALIYHEHFIEHLGVDDGLVFLRECHRALRPGGTVRIATPSLEYVVDKYRSDSWRNQDWLTWPEYRFIRTRAEMLNIAFRWWGHLWLYDREELHRRLAEAGFNRVRDCEWGKSDVVDLRARETRADSILICEAEKVPDDLGSSTPSND